MSERKGYRGYIGSRSYLESRVPQHVQNLVVRDYCQRHDYRYLLSATEYAMDGCYMMLEEVLNEVRELDGIVLYSAFMLPKDQARRRDVYDRVLAAGATLHGAVENIVIRDQADIERLEDIWRVQGILGPVPQSLRGA